MGRLSFYFALSVVACLFLCGCATISDALSGFFDDGSDRGDNSALADAAATYNDGKPRVRPGVVVIVQVSSVGQQPVTMQAQVDQNGEIILPYLLDKPVLCDGLTLDVLKDKLMKAYEYYIKQPQLTVTFAPFDGKTGVSPWGTVTVLGEVASPGPVNMPPTMDLTVTKVLQAAGGLKPFANKGKIRITRCEKDGSKTITIVDLNEIGKEGRVEKDIALRAGDVVWVPESWY